MNKLVNIAIAVVVSAFIATNFYLLFSDKSVIAKSVYVNEYERLTPDDFTEEKPKEALVVPAQTYTVYVGQDETVESWLVTEGDSVFLGEELALLNTERADLNREVIEAQYDGLIEQKNDLESMIGDLTSERSASTSTTSSNINRNDGITELADKTTIELGLDVNFSVDVTQEGYYTEAIASAEQGLADVARQLVVVEAQLAQDPSNPALISPTDGVVSKVIRTGTTLAIDIFSSQKEMITYAKDHEWQEIETGDRVLLQGEGIEPGEEGTVSSVSTIHAEKNDLLATYKKLDKDKSMNPLSYYEVRIQPDSELASIPFSQNVNAVIITNEVFSATSLNEKWLRKNTEESAQGTIITELGRASVVEVVTPFTWRNRAIVTSGLQSDDIAINDRSVGGYDYEPRVYMPMPSYMPTKKEWKSFGWKNYVRHLIVK